MIVFISCVKLKKNKKSRARELYISDLFKKSYAYAKSLKPKNIYILSAKYGLLKENDIIEPYDLTLNKMKESERKKWAIMVIKQCIKENISKDEKIIFLCGNSYRKYLVKYFKNSSVPLEKLSFGNQLKFYKKNIKII